MTNEMINEMIDSNKPINISDIQNITEHCCNLLFFTDYLREDSAVKEAYTLTEEILSSIRKLFIASMMYDKTLICIAGLQGAGKTTLMKNFYGIDDKYLNISLGTGERIPVLITEKKDITDPKMYAIKIDKDEENNKYKRREVELSAADFVNASKGNDLNIMYLELYVPYKHILNERTSFILLPGLEKNKDDWNNLIEFSVNSSDAAVFVFNESSFSNAYNDSYLKHIEGKFGENLVYAISNTEADPEEKIKQTCIETLKIPADKVDRVVCVGSYNDDKKNAIWIENLKKAIDKYVMRRTIHSLKNNNDYLYKEIEKVENILHQINNILDDDSSVEIKKDSDEKLLKAFDVSVKKKREELEKSIEREFENGKYESGKKLIEQFEENSNGWKLFKRALFGNNVREEFIQTRERVEKALKCDDEYLPDKHLIEALKHVLSALDQPKNRTDLSRLIDTKRENGKIVLLPDEKNTQAMKKDILTLLSDNENEEKQLLQSKDGKKLIGAVVEMSTYYYILKSHDYIAEEAGLSYYEPLQTKLSSKDIINGAESSKKFAFGIAGMMGIDLMGDGSVNMIAQIAESLGVAAPVAGAVAIGILGSGASIVLTRDLNRMQREDFLAAKLTVDAIYDNFKEEVLNQYDTYMNKIRERIEDNIIQLGDDKKKIIVKYNAKIEVKNTMDILHKIKKKSIEAKYGLGTLSFE